MRSYDAHHTINPQLRPPKRHNPRIEGRERHRSDQPVTNTHLDNHRISEKHRTYIAMTCIQNLPHCIRLMSKHSASCE